ncbi:MAG: phage holin family protein [Candidatus Liptonbacteria bacterium]
MRWLSRIILAVAINLIAILAANQWISGFRVSGGFEEWLMAAGILTLLNFLVKPVLKLVLGPIIVLTLGLGLVLVNMVVIYLLDRFSQDISIETVLALLYGSILIGALNFFMHLAINRKDE